MADDDRIEPHDFASQLDGYAEAAGNESAAQDKTAQDKTTADAPGPDATFAPNTSSHADAVSNGSDLLAQITAGGRSFWAAVYEPFLNRDLNRAQVKAFVRQGLAVAEGSYRRLVSTLRMPEHEYQRFMDFLRHHNLKP